MSYPLKLLLVAGARPNFMKVAPLIHAIQRHNLAIGGTGASPVPAGDSPGAPAVPQPPTLSSGPDPISGLSESQLSAFSSPHSEDPLPLVVSPPSPPRPGRGQGEVSNPLQPRISYRLVHTGQHYDAAMSDVFFRELGIPAPDFNLEVGSGSHAVQTAQVMLKFEPVLLTAFSDRGDALLRAGEKVDGVRMRCDSGEVSNSPSAPNFSSQPSAGTRSEFQLSAFSSQPSGSPPSSHTLPDWVVVVGDVNSTVACTLVASKLGIKVAHVEAGLRSFDRTMPEEINRLVTDTLADLLLTPSEDANENLRREGVPEHRIKLVGNIMIDALVANLPAARASQILQRLGVPSGGYVYVTLHRPSNVDSPDSLRAIMAELKNLAERLPVIFPMHPRTRKMLADFGISITQPSVLRPPSSLLVLDPIGYHDSLCLTENARLVLTDSGGLQEESTYFRTPCLTLRPNTERPVTVTEGSNRLTDLTRLPGHLAELLKENSRMGSVPPLWDGKTASRIVNVLQQSAQL